MMIEGIILAAGLSSRAGVFKMALKLQERSLIEHTVDAMMDNCRRIILVGGYRIERLKFLVSSYPEVRVVYNRHYSLGMFSSVQEGVRHLKGDLFFLIPGDCPFVRQSTYRQLLLAAKSGGGPDIWVPVYQGRKGHPVLVKGFLGAEILKEPLNSTLRDFIRRKGYREVEVEDEGILKDIDTAADIKKARSCHENRTET
jgi:molybdenum cofactor cytidylyltransferase